MDGNIKSHRQTFPRVLAGQEESSGSGRDDGGSTESRYRNVCFCSLRLLHHVFRLSERVARMNPSGEVSLMTHNLNLPYRIRQWRSSGQPTLTTTTNVMPCKNNACCLSILCWMRTASFTVSWSNVIRKTVLVLTIWTTACSKALLLNPELSFFTFLNLRLRAENIIIFCRLLMFA